MAYEVTRDLPMEEVDIETPVASMRARVLAGRKLGIVPILRAGLGMAEGVMELIPAAEAVASGEFDRGILICGTGIGVSICANKVRGIRCALCGDVLSAELTRQHNDSNMLAMGGRIIGIETAKAIVKTWLCTEFAGGRHERRIGKISDYECR